STCSGLHASQETNRTGPMASRSAMATSPLSADRPAMTTDAPSSRNFRAAATPMPVVPPTIRQRLLCNCFDMLSLSPIQRRYAPGILGVKVFQLLLNRSVADELMAGQEHRLDAAVHQALSDLAAKHVHDHGAAQGAEGPGLVPATLQVQERIAHGSAVIENN